MKNKENIKNINKLSISYVMLKGLKGQILEKENPFLIYLMFNMIFKGSNKSDDNIFTKIKKGDTEKQIYTLDYNSENENINIIPNDLFHMIIEESYDMYLNMSDIKNLIDPMIKEQLIHYLDDKDDFINGLIEDYKNTLVSIILNFNSNRIQYNTIKIDILKEELEYVVDIEDYDTAIIYRDKIKDAEKRILDYNKKRTV